MELAANIIFSQKEALHELKGLLQLRALRLCITWRRVTEYVQRAQGAGSKLFKVVSIMERKVITNGFLEAIINYELKKG